MTKTSPQRYASGGRPAIAPRLEVCESATCRCTALPDASTTSIRNACPGNHSARLSSCPKEFTLNNCRLRSAFCRPAAPSCSSMFSDVRNLQLSKGPSTFQSPSDYYRRGPILASKRSGLNMNTQRISPSISKEVNLSSPTTNRQRSHNSTIYRVGSSHQKPGLKVAMIGDRDLIPYARSAIADLFKWSPGGLIQTFATISLQLQRAICLPNFQQLVDRPKGDLTLSILMYGMINFFLRWIRMTA